MYYNKILNLNIKQGGYVHEANPPFKAQLEERYYAKKDGRKYNELIAPQPSGVLNVVKRKIEKELPFNWALYSRALFKDILFNFI